MFDFEKLEVYQVIKNHNIKVQNYIISKPDIDEVILARWKKASLEILLNLAEGTGRMNDIDKMEYLTLSRSCVFESVALLDLLKGMNQLSEDLYKEFYDGYEQASKMLLGMYRSYAAKI
jgi:four helix bundle protein